jgi:hypothetical protein
MSKMSDNRVILALAAETDDEFAWDHLRQIQTDMFAAGPVSVKFAYYGAEGAGQTRPCITTRWITDADDMADVMDHGRTHCICGCFVNVGDILERALKEVQQRPVQALIIVGDHFHGNADQAITCAEQLRAAGTRLFMFQQGRSSETENVFRALAERTAGAYSQFNPAVERVAKRLPGMLEAVAHFAIGGIEALQTRDTKATGLLLEQMRAAGVIKATRQ